MKKNYNLVVIVTILLLTLSIFITYTNYTVSLNATKNQLKNQALTLSLDNIYTDIQQNIIEPYIVSSMMSNDIFVKDWLKQKKKDPNKIFNYLATIKENYPDYNIYSTFLADASTHIYYKPPTKTIFMEEHNQIDNWYFRFKNSNKDKEININYNESYELTFFFNFKIYDENKNLLGITGIGLNYPSVNDRLKKFRKEHGFIVNFYNKEGKLLLVEKNQKEDMVSNAYRNKIIKKLLKSDTSTLEYESNDINYILRKKYIKELDVYMIVEAKVEDFTSEVEDMFNFNLLITLIISIIVLLIVINLLNSYHKKLNSLANSDPLTDIANRRYFTEKFEDYFHLSKRTKNPLSLLFVDLDNFKSINDTYGHDVGDEVLKRVAILFDDNIRKTDYLGRWGGEEFVILFTDANIENSVNLANKLCEAIQLDENLRKMVISPLTGSFGITQIHTDDISIDEAIVRADKAMYQAKKTGKNKVVKILR
jgi:diguanylate cyclase (GGDEF)-like protein